MLYAGAVLLGSILIGQLILNAMGIRLVSFQLGGGIILFLFGLQMIFGSDSNKAKQDPENYLLKNFLLDKYKQVFGKDYLTSTN